MRRNQTKLLKAWAEEDPVIAKLMKKHGKELQRELAKHAAAAIDHFFMTRVATKPKRKGR